jgi:hypothetical protein
VHRRGRLNLATLGFGLLISLTVVSAAQAQLCFRGHPRPRCSGFAVLEFSGMARLNRKEGPSDQTPGIFSWHAGYLQSVGARSALGAALKLTADGDGHRFGPVLRYRQWLGPTWSLDVAPGILLSGEDNFTLLRFPSATADVTINWGDRVGVTLGADLLRRKSGGESWESYLGLRFGTWLAPLAMVGLGIAAGAAAN